MNIRSSVRNAKRQRPGTWRKKFFRLNVFPEEHQSDIDDIVFEEVEDDESRFLKMSIVSLETKLMQTEEQLEKTQRHSNEVDQTNMTLRDKTTFLQNHLSATEKEADDSTSQKIQLEARVKAMESQQRREEKENGKVLGKRKFSELGASGIKKTRTAYNNQFKDKINSYGETRGLMLECLILRDENGDQLIVNAERPHTFENLTPGEKRRVDRVLRWKDLKRISDAAYAEIKRADGTSLPASSHIKQQEKHLNGLLPTFHQVSTHIFIIRTSLFFLRLSILIFKSI